MGKNEELGIEIIIDSASNKKNNNYRFRLSKDFKKDLADFKECIIILETSMFVGSIVCGNYHIEIENEKIDWWIKHKGFHLYPDRKPTILIFKLNKNLITTIPLLLFCYHKTK